LSTDKSSGRSILPLVVSLIGIIGVMVGGLVTYFGNKELQDYQAERAAQQAEDVKKGTARVLVGMLQSGDDAYARSLQDCRYRLYEPETRLPLDDRKRLASTLGAREWKRVAKGLEALRLQYERSREKHDFASYDVVQIRATRKRMFAAQNALTHLADTPADRSSSIRTGMDCRIRSG
jgi:hypothetical protein